MYVCRPVDRQFEIDMYSHSSGLVRDCCGSRTSLHNLTGNPSLRGKAVIDEWSLALRKRWKVLSYVGLSLSRVLR